MTVLDASALLAFLQGEPGADDVEACMVAGAVCGAANWSEVAQKVASGGGDWTMASRWIGTFGVVVEPVTLEDAERAAALWSRGSGLSLADRLCLALADRLGEEVWTADRSWARVAGVQVHLLR